MGELERRKFTAEEGDHLTLLNGALSSPLREENLTPRTAFNAFVQVGRKSAKWCHQHRLNFKALSRAVSIRMQLRKYLQRFDISLKSCGEDHAAIRKCLTSGYFKKRVRLLSFDAFSRLT